MKKKVYLEILRLAAGFLVIYNHTRAHGFDLYRYAEAGSVTYFASLAFSVLCKMAVPLFFMISGTLLLEKEESLKTFFTKRVLRIVAVILIFTFLQYVRLILAQGGALSITEYLKICYGSNVIEPYWFLYAYLAFLLLVPVMRKAVKDRDGVMGLYVLAIGLLALVTRCIAVFAGLGFNVNLLLATDIVFYPLAGFYIDRECIGKAKGFFLSIPAQVFTLVCSLILGVITVQTDLFTPLIAISFFSLIRRISVRSEKASDVIASLGGCVFGTYLIEDVIRNVFEFRLGWNFAAPAPFTSAILFTLACYATGMAVIWLVKKIPFVSKLL